MVLRSSGRQCQQLRAVSFIRDYTRYAEGSVLASFGDTKVICTATVENSVPSFLQGSGSGWLTAEYSMLPRAVACRNKREAIKPAGRSQEIQRLIGRSLRAALDLNALGERQIIIDCDVIQADGGTRCASINGGFVALYDAIKHLLNQNVLKVNPIRHAVAAVAVGIYQGEILLDLDYQEDSQCTTDMNVVMAEDGALVEVQASAERALFSRQQMMQLIDIAHVGIAEVIQQQRCSLGLM